MTCAISWFFLAYFVILFYERAQSLVKIARTKDQKLLPGGFSGHVNCVAALSLLATLVLLGTANAGFWRSLFDPSVTPDYSLLCLTAGTILVSGMVHTDHTVPGIQFASYGMLIVAMILETLVAVRAGSNALRCWYGLVYLTAFSMAIPVMYESKIQKARLFHSLEAVTSLVLVACFTLLLQRMFTGRGDSLLPVLPILLAVAGDGAILALRWKEKKNTFVLIFLAVSCVLFLIGRILFALAG